MPPELASRQAVQPWMIVTSVFLASGSGLWYQLGALKQAGGHPSASWAADSLSRAWHEGVDHATFDAAKEHSSEVLEEVIQSQLGLFFLCSLFLSTYALGALVTKALFLGQLTIIESTKLAERMLKFVMLKVVFLGAVVNPEPHELGTWLLWFAVLAYFRAFVGLARDRCEALLSSPSATPLQHARCLVLLGGILGQTASWVASYAAATLPDPTPARVSHALLWLFDAVCIFIEASHAVLKYGVHAAERFRAQRAEAAGEPPAAGGWEGQAPLLYHAEVLVDLVLHVLTLTHYCHLWWLHGFKLQLIDAVLFLDVRYLVVGIWRRVRGFARYRALTHRLQHSFPPIPAEQLVERDCAICMERLRSARALPCGHAFHLGCLRAWLQQAHGGDFTCPLCRARLDITGGKKKGRGTTMLGQPALGVRGVASGPSIPGRFRQSDGGAAFSRTHNNNHTALSRSATASARERGATSLQLARSQSNSRFPSPTPSLPAPLFDLLAGGGRQMDNDEDDLGDFRPHNDSFSVERAAQPSVIVMSLSSLRPRSWGGCETLPNVQVEDDDEEIHPTTSGAGLVPQQPSRSMLLDAPHTLTERIASVSLQTLSGAFHQRSSRAALSGMEQHSVRTVAQQQQEEEVSSRPRADPGLEHQPAPSRAKVSSRGAAPSHRYATRQRTRTVQGALL